MHEMSPLFKIHNQFMVELQTKNEDVFFNYCIFVSLVF